MTVNNIAATFLLGGIALSTQAQADFLRDGKATLGLKNFYFNNDSREGAAKPSKTEEWAQGFMLDYKSGYTDGVFGFGVDALGLLGVTLDGGKGRSVGSTMIPVGSDDRPVSQWGRLGLTGKVKVSRTELRYGTLLPRLPVLVANDGRLLPQTFEGGQVVSRELANVTFNGGRIEHATGRGSTDRTGLAAVGGQRESNQFNFAGADWRVSRDLLAQYYYGHLEDYYSQQFLDWFTPLSFRMTSL